MVVVSPADNLCKQFGKLKEFKYKKSKGIINIVFNSIRVAVVSDLIIYIFSCICPSADRRPDITTLAGQMADIMLKHMDAITNSQHTLERKLDRERKRTQK